MQAVGSGVGGSSYQSTSNRMQHGVITKEVAKHERANTQAPKEIKTVSAVERAMNSHKLNQTTKGSKNERSSNSSSMQEARSKSNEIKEKMLNDSVDKAYEKAKSSGRADSSVNSSEHEKSVQNPNRVGTDTFKAENKENIKAAAVAVVSNADMLKTQIDDVAAKVLKNIEIPLEKLKMAGAAVKGIATAYSVVSDINILKSPESSDFQKEMAQISVGATGLSVIAGPVPGAIGSLISVTGNVVYSLSSESGKEKLNSLSDEKPVNYLKGLDEVIAKSKKTNLSSGNKKTNRSNKYYKKVTVANQKLVPKIKSLFSRIKDLDSKKLSADKQRAANVAKYKAKKQKEAARKIKAEAAVEAKAAAAAVAEEAAAVAEEAAAVAEEAAAVAEEAAVEEAAEAEGDSNGYYFKRGM